MFKWRQQYDEKRDAIEREATDVVCKDESLCMQSYADEANINTLVGRFGLSETAIPPSAMDPRYFGDFSDIPDMRTAMDRVRDAQDKFNALPAKLRARFHNSPGELWSFINDEGNRDEAVRLGLLFEAKTDPQDPPAGSAAPPAP